MRRVVGHRDERRRSHATSQFDREGRDGVRGWRHRRGRGVLGRGGRAREGSNPFYACKPSKTRSRGPAGRGPGRGWCEDVSASRRPGPRSHRPGAGRRRPRSWPGCRSQGCSWGRTDGLIEASPVEGRARQRPDGLFASDRGGEADRPRHPLLGRQRSRPNGALGAWPPGRASLSHGGGRRRESCARSKSSPAAIRMGPMARRATATQCSRPSSRQRT